MAVPVAAMAAATGCAATAAGAVWAAICRMPTTTGEAMAAAADAAAAPWDGHIAEPGGADADEAYVASRSGVGVMCLMGTTRQVAIGEATKFVGGGLQGVCVVGATERTW
mmetsp:Transcript_114939/g.287247  ORF Transcript_114939/g.287247 Transcript_114939/m.287247 type:complete len:110 (-) Transcript_114939:289-618(-)